MTVSPGDVVRAVNNEDHPIRIGYARLEYQLQPHQEIAVPADAIFLWFGDPRSEENMKSIENRDGTTAWVPDRATEVRRLLVKWGSMDEQLHAPDVQVYTLDGEEVWTVTRDPEGRHTQPGKFTHAEFNDYSDHIKQLQDQVAYLIQQQTLGQTETASGTPIPEATEADIPTDEGGETTKAPRFIKAKAAVE